MAYCHRAARGPVLCAQAERAGYLRGVRPVETQRGMSRLPLARRGWGNRSADPTNAIETALPTCAPAR